MNERPEKRFVNVSVGPQRRALAVLGPFRGGTSVTCGVLHQLGVFVGNQFWDAGSKYCTYEALGLRTSCNACFDERPGKWNYQGTPSQRIAQLKHWIDFARTQASNRGCIGVGGKHPTLCKLVDETAVAWQTQEGVPPLFISVIRPLDEVLRGWEKATNANGRPWWRRPDRAQIVKDLIESRDRRLERYEHVCVEYASLTRDPMDTITKLADRCHLPIINLDSAVHLVQRAALIGGSGR